MVGAVRRMAGAVLGVALLAGAGAAPAQTAELAASAAPAEGAETAAVDPERYDFDVAHTSISFVVRHLAVTNVRGRFDRFSGRITLDPADVTRSSVSVTIEARSIDTANERRDDHLRSSDFFDVEQFPQLTFESRRVERHGEGLVAIGDLTIRDVTREVAIPFELTGPVDVGNGQKVIGAEASLRINRFDYGLQWNRFTEAVQVVGDEVRIELNVSARTPRRP